IGGAGNDTLTGSSTHATGAGQDDNRLYGGAGNDILNGGDGNDTLFGGAGDDTLNGGNDFGAFAGQAGYGDFVSYEDADAAVTVNLAAGTATGQGSDTLSGIEGAYGSDFDDTLFGGAGNDMLYGGYGDDVIQGGAGNDSMDGGDGNSDLLDYSDQSGNVDVALSTNSTNVDSDSISDFEGVIGGAGNDTLSGEDAGGPANMSWVYGDEFDVDLDVLAGADEFFGGAGNDIIDGLGGNDHIQGGLGSDLLDGGDGNTDILDYSEQVVAVNIDLENDTMSGGDAIDTISGFEGVIGGTGGDMLFGSSAENVIDGGAGNDTIAGGDGNDQLSGGTGDDIFVFSGSFGDDRDVIMDFSNAGQNDSIQLDLDLFTALTTTTGNTLLSTEFKANDTGTADEADDRIIYNTLTGDLYYDADGIGGGGTTFITNVSSGVAGEPPPTLTAADFLVVDMGP
ncbi:MAG: hypothetical protein A3H91_05850, partial [Gammaproteobacteria bacterium RIFCSPLOWO2_02_FULL_61_13]